MIFTVAESLENDTFITKKSEKIMKNTRSIHEIEHLLQRLKKILEEIYSERLIKVVLYGSFARHEATDDSDIDIAVVLKGTPDKIKEIDTIHDVIHPLTLEYGEVISINPVSEEELQDDEWPLYFHIEHDGINI